MNGILRFTTNIPEEVVLQSLHGRRVEGRYGEQMLYTLVDDRVAYVPLIVADRIRELDIGQGEPFEICKAEVRNGNRRWIEWQVRRLEEPQQPPSSGNGSVAAASVLTESQNHRNGNTNGSSNGKAYPRFETASDGTLLPVPISGPGVTVMEVAMNAAAEIVQRVESRAALRNHPLHFTSEDIRAIGLTMFIQASREGGARWEA